MNNRWVSLSPRVNLTRFHGVFAPNSKWRALVTPAKRGKSKKLPEEVCSDKSPAERRAAMTWSQRLKRVFNIDVEGTVNLTSSLYHITDENL